MSFGSYLGDRLARQRSQREAKRFAQTVEAGRTYYSVEDCWQSWGDGPQVQTWRFEERRGGELRCGHMSPALVWLNYGPLFDTDPGPHIPRIFEGDADHISERNLKEAFEDFLRRAA